MLHQKGIAKMLARLSGHHTQHTYHTQQAHGRTARAVSIL